MLRALRVIQCWALGGHDLVALSIQWHGESRVIGDRCRRCGGMWPL